MGQAKLRGSQSERVAQAKDKKVASSEVDLLRPDKLFCTECETEVPKFELMTSAGYPGIIDARGFPGVKAIYGGICPDCHALGYYAIGDSTAIESLEDQMIDRGVIGTLHPNNEAV